MLTVKLLAIELGVLLIYCGIKGISVTRAILGDNKVAQPNQGIAK